MTENYFDRYLPLLVHLLVAMGIGAGMIGLSALLGKRRWNKAKMTQYESGMLPQGDARHRFSVKFYLVGLLFILFDVETVYLITWGLAYKGLIREHQFWFAFGPMLFFLLILTAGFVYEWKKGVLDWNKNEGNI
jgi:NADH-quinone oxidoreductase subunit A